MIELDRNSWGDKGLSDYWGGERRQLVGPGELTSVVTWTDSGSTDSWEDGYYRFDVGLGRDGSVWQWRVENLGTDSTNKAMAPFRVRGDAREMLGLTDATAIRAGEGFCVALTRDGTVWTLGQQRRWPTG